MITIISPDDFHVHLRQNRILRLVGPFTAGQFARALVMPNTDPPILTAEDVVRYRAEILDACGDRFVPLMTIYLTSGTTREVIRKAKIAGVIAGKWYPKGVTTGSTAGAENVRELYPALGEMQEQNMVLSIHGQKPGNIDSFAREEKFLPILEQIAKDFPRLKVVMEHLSTKAAIDRVLQLGNNIAATITVHHMILTRNDFMDGVLQPHNFCIPPAQRAEDRNALIDAATSGNPKFIFGSDSAPHLLSSKECKRGKGGIFTAPVALPLLTQIFEKCNVLDKLGCFVSKFGANFYSLPQNTGTINLVKEDWTVPEEYEGIAIFRAGKTLHWRVA